MKPSAALFLLSAALLGPAFSQPLTREVIAPGLNDPMAIAIAPDGDIYLTELQGSVLRVRPSTGGVFKIGEIPVEHLKKSDPDSHYAREDGLQGLALDPDFATNQRIYLYYSAPEKLLNRLSRFTLKDGEIDMTSEKMLLEVPTQRADGVCHHGGAVHFGPDGLLYLSLGDNTSPSESDGSNPVDEREGHEYANAQRSAGNSNDLRGKILRIRPTEAGYDIPPGNLFPPGTAKTRPEIYVMGCRNPFRFSIDARKNVLYWGEVGPDAWKDTDRGPMGYDEINQAKKAGYYGWPFIIADNKPYARYDFATKAHGEKYDPAAPKNTSRLNTGLTDLPPAVPAFIWYPYSNSKEFPVMGGGGRNAMAGPIFYHQPERKFNLLAPQDDHTLLTYDWMRGKIFKAKLGAEEKLESLTLLAEGFTHPMDLQMAADGSLWLLEYGSEWWFNNNGKVLRLTPETGNKPPVVTIDQTGQTFKATTSDPDNDPVALTWWLTTGSTEKNLGSTPEIPLTGIGNGGSELRAVATDGKGGQSVARLSLAKKAVEIPLTLELAGDPKSLAFGQDVAFKINSTSPPDAQKTVVRARYIAPTGHDAGGAAFDPEIEKLVTARLCLACHQVRQTSVGPNYLAVSLKYRGNPAAADHLKTKIKTGGAGVWGATPMPAQVAASDDEIAKIVDAILHLGDGISEATGTQGTLKLSAKPAEASPDGAWEITVESPGFAPFSTRIPER
jgi:cytochrome c